MDKNELPKWLTEQDDGSLLISFQDLKKRPSFDGTEVAQIAMREPTVQDQLTADKSHKHAGDKEVAMIANLTEQSPEAISALTMKQYARCQEALGFLNG